MQDNYIVQRRIKQQKLRRKARRGEITIRRLYKLVRFLFILFLFYAAYRLSTAHYWYLSGDIYETPEKGQIEILGNSIVSNDRIIAEIKKYPLEKKPLYKINPEKIANRIEQLTPVKRAYVRRFWLPARLVVMVEEITPALTISPAEDTPAVAAFARTGEMIGREYLPLDTRCNAVRILSYGTKNDDYENWDTEKINNLYNLAKTIEQYAQEKVLYIDLRIPHNAFAQTESAKIKLGEIDTSVYERIKAIHDILPAVKELKLKTKYIDLSWRDAKYIKEDV